MQVDDPCAAGTGHAEHIEPQVATAVLLTHVPLQSCVAPVHPHALFVQCLPPVHAMAQPLQFASSVA